MQTLDASFSDLKLLKASLDSEDTVSSLRRKRLIASRPLAIASAVGSTT